MIRISSKASPEAAKALKGLKWLDFGWESMVSNSPTYSFTLDGPITLVASWRTESNAASISAIVVAVLAIVLTVLTALQLRIRKPRLLGLKGEI